MKVHKNTRRPAVTYDRPFFFISPVLAMGIQMKIINKNIGDFNYGNERHLEQNVEPRGTFS